ncbi:MAG: insulinase family protein [Planctomycetes bacterium]|jgi:zinc protease|nr:insulinase family protein [Planctomycetota bacterium]
MSRRLPLLLLPLLLLPATAPAAELVTRIDLATGIGETVLANGLRVLTLERHNAPVVAVQIFYRVGSADEGPGETGLAHFLEHLMFKGTDRYARGAIDRITLELGGSNNAATSKDWTQYWFSLASDRFETALEIEANRMKNLAFDPVDFEMERKVVLEELSIGRDGPWGELDETVEAAHFLAHPYRHPIIGWRTDIEQVTREQVKAFYARHYRPDNATLVLVGDFDTGRALARILELFGPVETGPVPVRARTPEPAQNGERRIVVSRPEEIARIEVLWHSVPLSSPDDAVLDVIRHVLVGDRASRLFRRVVEVEQTATGISGTNDSRRDSGVFYLWAEVMDGADPGRVERAIVEETERLVREPPTEDELLRARNSILTTLAFNRATAAGRAEEIGIFATMADWRLTATSEERIRAVTAEDVRRVAARVFAAENRSVGLTGPKSGGGARAFAEPAGSARRSAGDAAPAGPRVHLAPLVRTLGNGLTLLVARNDTVPVFALNVFVRDARLREARPGLAWLTAKHLLEGAGELDAEGFARAQSRLGASIETNPAGLSARCRTENAGDLLALVADLLVRPALPAEPLPKLLARQGAEIRAERDDPATLAGQLFAQAVYGAHPLGRPSRGTPESLGEITIEDVRAHHRTFFAPGNAIVAAVSDRPEEETAELLAAAFGDWPAVPAAPVAELPGLPEPAARMIRVNRPMDQAILLLGHRGIRREDPDWVPLLVMDYVLGRGPGFTDRLSRTLRDRDGLAYEVWATITESADQEPGVFKAYIGTSAEQEGRAAEGIVEAIRAIRETTAADSELAGAKAYLLGSFVFGFETAEQVAGMLVHLHRLGLGFDWPEKYAKAVAAVTAEDVLRVAREHLHPDRLVRVVVGPAD